MNKWQTKTLGEVTSYMAKGIAPKYVIEGTKGAIRVLNQKCNRNSRILYENSRWHDNVAKTVQIDKILLSGDVLINSTGIGTAGRVAQIWDIPSPTTVDGHMIIMRPSKDMDPLFYGYAVKAAQSSIEEYAEGSTGQTEINKTRLQKEIVISFPTEKEMQHQIGSLLKNIDDKIELNEHINQNLEMQSQLIFNKEFLSNAIIPSGWEESNLLATADYLNGLAMQKFRPVGEDTGLPVLKIKELRQGMCDETSERCSSNINPQYIVQDGDVIFSWSGSLLVDFWCGGICGLNQHLFKVTSNKFDKWFYYAWTKHYLANFSAIAADMATTMGHIKREELAKAKVLIPSEKDYNRISSIMQPIYDLIIANRIQNRELSNIRDNLLPKLMSGELDISEVHI